MTSVAAALREIDKMRHALRLVRRRLALDPRPTARAAEVAAERLQADLVKITRRPLNAAAPQLQAVARALAELQALLGGEGGAPC